MKKFLTTFALISLMSAPVMADECTEAIGLQALDILSQELNVSYDVATAWTGYEEENVKFIAKKGEVELYQTKINTGSDVYALDLTVDYMCDVVDYKVVNENEKVKQCVETCYAFYSKPSAQFKYCIASCKGKTLNDSAR